MGHCDGEVTILDNRTQPALAYVGISLEHAELLSSSRANGLRGSAFELVRLIFENLYRVAWMYGGAKPEELRNRGKKSFEFPTIRKMVDAIDGEKGQGSFTQFKELSWADQNDFTHSGDLPRISQFAGKNLQSHYPDHMVIAQVYTSLSAALMLCVVFLKNTQRIADCEKLETLIEQLDITNLSLPLDTEDMGRIPKLSPAKEDVKSGGKHSPTK
jgi:hypothetical protein